MPTGEIWKVVQTNLHSLTGNSGATTAKCNNENYTLSASCYLRSGASIRTSPGIRAPTLAIISHWFSGTIQIECPAMFASEIQFSTSSTLESPRVRSEIRLSRIFQLKNLNFGFHVCYEKGKKLW